VTVGIEKLAMFAILLTVLLAGCNSELEDKPSKIHVLVAASATSAVQEVADAYLEQLADDAAAPKIVIVSGPSSGLAQQILSGAPADMFISANPKWRNAVRGQTLDSKLLFKNRLVIATHILNPKEIESVAVAGEFVPVGDYANQVIQQLPVGDLESIKSKLVFAKDASALVAWLESNEVDAGFVYASDAIRSAKLHVVETIDVGLHDPIIYSLTRIEQEGMERDVPKLVQCDDFFSWLQSDEAQAIFQESGFSVP
jgi:molybdate transport system substrate-binding protein